MTRPETGQRDRVLLRAMAGVWLALLVATAWFFPRSLYPPETLDAVFILLWATLWGISLGVAAPFLDASRRERKRFDPLATAVVVTAPLYAIAVVLLRVWLA